MRKKAAVSAINKHGMLLVFPIDNANAPLSLWSAAYPKTKMRWEWDEDGDDRVSSLWHLREELSRSEEVVYTKWYRGRATFFSCQVFTALLATFLHNPISLQSLSTQAREILEVLEGDSPLSTKALKRATGLQGRAQEAAYTRALKELWSRLLIVGFGEVDEGAFPSLAVGASEVLFEDVYKKALKMPQSVALKIVRPLFEKEPLVEKFFTRTTDSLKKVQQSKSPSLGYIEFKS